MHICTGRLGRGGMPEALLSRCLMRPRSCFGAAYEFIVSMMKAIRIFLLQGTPGHPAGVSRHHEWSYSWIC